MLCNASAESSELECCPEIARLAGVTERTISKYVEKHGWKRRYRVVARDEAVARANRGRHRLPSPDLAPVKGAGGRFIRREDCDKPIAVGLQATDPTAAKLAAAACGGAAHLSAVAQAAAEEAQRAERLISAIDVTNLVLKNLVEHRRECAGKAASPISDRAESLLVDLFALSLKQWEPWMPGGQPRAAD